MLDGILWTDLNSAEQAAIIFLREGLSLEACDPAAVKSLRRIGLIAGNRLSKDGERMSLSTRSKAQVRAA
jgi:hypothetical protein